MSETGKVSHVRSVSFPRGARFSVEDFVALAKLAEERTKDVHWNVRLPDRKLSGQGHVALYEAVQNTRGRVRDVDLFATEGFMTDSSVSVSLGEGGRVMISGASLDWVAGTRERFQEEIKQRARVSFWWRFGGLPILAFWALLCAAVVTTTATALAARGMLSVTEGGLRINAAWAASVGAVAAFFVSRTEFAASRLILKTQALTSRSWFQHPLIESAKTVAVFIGAAWALMQIVRFLR